MPTPRTKVDKKDVKIAGVPNPAAAVAAVAAFIGRWGITKAIKKYGERAVMRAGKTKDLSSKGELGPAGHLSASKPMKVKGTKTQAGTEMPPTQIDVNAAGAARRAANKKAQMKRGKQKIAKGAGAVAGTAATVAGVAAAIPKKGTGSANTGKRSSNNQDRRKRIQARAAKAKAETRAKASAAAKDKAKADTNAKFASARKTIKDAVVAKPKGPKTNPTGARTIAASRKAKGTTFTGRDERQKANVTREELAASGFKGKDALRDYLNKQQGKTRRKTPTKKKAGGTIRSYASGGTVRGAGKATKGIRPCKIR